MKAPFPRILGLNLAVLLVTGVASRIHAEGSRTEAAGLGFIIEFAFAIFVQFLLNVLRGLVARSEAVKQSFWTAALVTLLVGFGTCIGGTFTY